MHNTVSPRLQSGMWRDASPENGPPLPNMYINGWMRK